MADQGIKCAFCASCICATLQTLTETARHAKTIRKSRMHKPMSGFQMWPRLEMRFPVRSKVKQILENNLHRPSPSLTRRLGSPVAPGKLKSRKFSSLDEVLDFEWAFR
ncbi:hypothetical protein M408DRAFT_296133 [Serendipita vermifera MAFF 305830]|uniref:Uncharacterized protein n=1 Tax=Serendipita vermifera MAFF 305830 TaxID=933852 RepID=A0A0C3B0H4_SERVB|nr:hypothetical protein M408DRAFT_296133 [Serendipita vermifera MAFF 305830]